MEEERKGRKETGKERWKKGKKEGTVDRGRE